MNVTKAVVTGGNEIGALVRALRARLGLRQDQVAERGKIRREEVSIVEAGKNKVSTNRMLNGLALGFAVDPRALRAYLDGELSLDGLVTGESPRELDANGATPREAIDDGERYAAIMLLVRRNYDMRRAEHAVEWVLNEPARLAWPGERTVERAARLAAALIDADDQGATPATERGIRGQATSSQRSGRRSRSTKGGATGTQKRAFFAQADELMDQPSRGGAGKAGE